MTAMRAIHEIPKIFFAYSSRPESLAEVIESAIDMINKTRYVEAISWKRLAVSGHLIIREVCAAIDESSVVVCELTHLNPNVLFELGYAVARNKRVWLLLDPSFPNAENQYKKVQLLSPVGYVKYFNSEDIVKHFFEDQPFEDPDATLYQDLIEPSLLTLTRPPSLFYLKTPVNTEAAIRLTRRLNKSPIPVITDDPSEVTLQTLAWYAQNTFTASAVIAHLLDEERAIPYLAQNAKYAFVSGFAFGLGKAILMLAHSPYQPAFDYQELLLVHTSATECIEATETWLTPIENAYVENDRRIVEHKKEAAAALVLQQIYLGDFLAENEQNDVSAYFIATAPYTEALHANSSMLYVGRKGTGKTANLLKISEELSRDKHNHVCIVKPLDYDLKGVLSLLDMALPHADRGYMLESLWKFLIYTQLAISIRERINLLPSHVPPTDAETTFLAYLESIFQIVSPDFSVRLETAVLELCAINLSAPSGSQRARISEILHSRILGDLREQIGHVLENKTKVCVLIDNLDKAWDSKADLPLLSEFLLSLLHVTHAISLEFAHSGPKWRSLRLPVIVFIRSDVFSYLISSVSEADKIPYTRMDWTDPRLLQRVIEERFCYATGGQVPPPDIWAKFFVPLIRGCSPKEYIVSRIIPRPRDIIYLCKASLAHAIDRGHVQIEEDDLIKAEADYSQYVYDTLVSETKLLIPGIENLLYEFAGLENDIINRQTLEGFAKRASITFTTDQLIRLLNDSLFLGLETSPGQFEFLYDQSRAPMIRTLAKRLVERTTEERYKINLPFHSYLEIAKNS